MIIMDKPDDNVKYIDDLLKEYDKIIDHDVTEAENTAKALEIDMPEEVRKKICDDYHFSLEATPKKSVLSSRCKEGTRLKIAVGIIVFFIVFSTGLILDPTPYIAVKKIIREIRFNDLGDSVQISIMHYPQIPESFELAETNNHTRKYINATGNYIKVSVYSSNYAVRADNEDCDVYAEKVINGNAAVETVKNGITTFYIYSGEKIIKLESDLPTEDVEAIAETIE